MKSAPPRTAHRLPEGKRRRPTLKALALLGLGWALQAPALASGPAASTPASTQTSTPTQASLPSSPAAPLQPCRLRGVKTDAQCGKVQRPLDPARPDGPKIDVHFAVLPALARHKKPDPVFFLAGGPGQSAISLAGVLSGPMNRLAMRRDIVLVDQRGTGRSAPLHCPEPDPSAPLAEAIDTARTVARLQACRDALLKLPHGDLRHYATPVAMADLDAVRAALGAERINLVGGSYGTRAGLEYLRQHPQRVRRALLDGVAPPDMVLPASFSTDAQAALDAVLAACEKEPACAARHPQLRSRWNALLARLPQPAEVPHPVTGRPERLTLTREVLTGLVRPVLYAPSLAAALPLALDEATQGRYTALVGLASTFAGGRNSPMRMAEGMHFSVICSEDLPRLRSGAAVDAPGVDFRDDFAAVYRRVCEGWPQGPVPEAFYTVPASPSPVLVMSGGADPVTPPRHGQRVAQALGDKARHVVVPQAGHGLMMHGCMSDVVFRFIDAEDDAQALKVDTACAEKMPRPAAFMPPGAASAPIRGATR